METVMETNFKNFKNRTHVQHMSNSLRLVCSVFLGFVFLMHTYLWEALRTSIEIMLFIHLNIQLLSK